MKAEDVDLEQLQRMEQNYGRRQRTPVDPLTATRIGGVILTLASLLWMGNLFLTYQKAHRLQPLQVPFAQLQTMPDGQECVFQTVAARSNPAREFGLVALDQWEEIPGRRGGHRELRNHVRPELLLEDVEGHGPPVTLVGEYQLVSGCSNYNNSPMVFRGIRAHDPVLVHGLLRHPSPEAPVCVKDAEILSLDYLKGPSPVAISVAGLLALLGVVLYRLPGYFQQTIPGT